MTPPRKGARWAMAVDTRTCVGCAACVIACKTENDLPEGYARNWIWTGTAGTYPDLTMEVRSERCNQCEDAPCVAACPTGASHYGPGGIVLVDRNKCTGCKACIAACPYGARFVDPRSHAVDKCTFCAHRIEQGIEVTACQEVCPTRSIHFGDLNDPDSEIVRLLARRESYTLLPEAGTRPRHYFVK
ncbi:MAG: 4Fe-4S dicluster domain-containing protein [Gemmatimonadetes bacterium]|nr:4Fe-4S dicluster domain-containing protein [Gemmatimonadota bacterium]